MVVITKGTWKKNTVQKLIYVYKEGVVQTLWILYHETCVSLQYVEKCWHLGVRNTWETYTFTTSWL